MISITLNPTKEQNAETDAISRRYLVERFYKKKHTHTRAQYEIHNVKK